MTEPRIDRVIPCYFRFRPIIRSRAFETSLLRPTVTQKTKQTQKKLEILGPRLRCLSKPNAKLGNSSHLYKMKFRRELAHAGEEISSDVKHGGRESARLRGVGMFRLPALRHVPECQMGIDRERD